MLGGLLIAIAVAAVAAWAFERRHRRTHPVPPGLRKEIDLPHTQTFELYHNALSLCSMKTRLCLAELSIPYASHHVDLIETGAYENISRRFLRVNPGGTVPVLVHGGHPVYESHEQIRHAAHHAPPGAPSLVPDEPALHEEMERWIDRSSLTEDPIAHGDVSAGNAVPGLTLPLFAAMIERIPYGKILEGLLFHWDRKRPLMFLLFKLRGLPALHRISPMMRLVARSRRQMAAHLDDLERQLASHGGPWILGTTFSLADVSWLVILERLAQTDVLHLFLGDGRRPAVADWWQRMQARPAYREAIVAHQHETVVQGTRRLMAAKAASPALRTALEGA